jgi:hypothetical protein
MCVRITEPRTVPELDNLPIKQVGNTTEGWERIDSQRGQRGAKLASTRRDDRSTGAKNDAAVGWMVRGVADSPL